MNSTSSGTVPSPVVPHEPLVKTVPLSLRQRPQWVCWRQEIRDGRATKVPYQVDGRLASTTNPATWTSFEHAVQAHQAHGYDGIGFVFSPDDPFAGIDLDNCLSQDGLAPWAARILRELNSYSEISPSGRGIKIWVKTTIPGTHHKRRIGDGAFEIYDQGRYFTVTGNHYPGAPKTIELRQVQIDSIYTKMFPPRGRQAKPAPPAAAIPDDDIIRIARRSVNAALFNRLWSGDVSDHDGDESAADLALCNLLAFYAGPNHHGTVDRLFRQSGLYRLKWDERRGSQTYGQMTIAKAYEGRSEFWRRRQTRLPRSPLGHRPTILIDTEEHRVVSETIAALTADGDVYQRGGVLVRVIRDTRPKDGIKRPAGSPTIQALPPANLRERMTRHANFTKLSKKGREVPAHPAAWLVAAVDARGDWPGIRHLFGVSDAPVLRPDGSVWQTPGYDEQTGVLFEGGQPFLPVPDDLTIDDSMMAREELLEVICDFPFETEEHKAAWLAALLTPLARFAFDGPSPLFLVDANVMGAGKGLLAQTVGRIVLGREMPASSYAHDTEEMRKRITAIAIAGDRMVLLDNLEGIFGNAALDRALTSTRWKDRVLGKSEEVDLPLVPAWYATGNNVAVTADTARRVIHARLDVLDEHPEQRTGFRHPNLSAWIAENRPRLLTAGLTVLSAYCRAGRPSQGLTPYGSFEGWSDLVRQAVVWVGMPDPYLTKVRLAETADTSADYLGQLIAAWKLYDLKNDGVVVLRLLAHLYPSRREDVPNDEAAIAMRAALESLVGCPSGKAPTARQIGNKLRHFRRRVHSGVYLDFNPNESNRAGAVWRLRHV